MRKTNHGYGTLFFFWGTRSPCRLPLTYLCRGFVKRSAKSGLPARGIKTLKSRERKTQGDFDNSETKESIICNRLFVCRLGAGGFSFEENAADNLQRRSRNEQTHKRETCSEAMFAHCMKHACCCVLSGFTTVALLQCRDHHLVNDSRNLVPPLSFAPCVYVFVRFSAYSIHAKCMTSVGYASLHVTVNTETRATCEPAL